MRSGGVGAASPPQGSLERPVPRSGWRGPHRLQRSYLGRPQRRRPRPQSTRPPQHSSILRGQGGKSTDGFKNANKTNIGKEAGGLAAGRGAPRQKHGQHRTGKPVLHSVPHPRARVSPGMAGHWTSDLGAGGAEGVRQFLGALWEAAAAFLKVGRADTLPLGWGFGRTGRPWLWGGAGADSFHAGPRGETGAGRGQGQTKP